jgi:hypothetical protein
MRIFSVERMKFRTNERKCKNSRIIIVFIEKNFMLSMGLWLNELYDRAAVPPVAVQFLNQ